MLKFDAEELRGKTVVCVASGGSIDLLFERMLEHGFQANLHHFPIKVEG